MTVGYDHYRGGAPDDRRKNVWYEICNSPFAQADDIDKATNGSFDDGASTATIGG